MKTRPHFLSRFFPFAWAGRSRSSLLSSIFTALSWAFSFVLCGTVAKSFTRSWRMTSKSNHVNVLSRFFSFARAGAPHSSSLSSNSTAFALPFPFPLSGLRVWARRRCSHACNPARLAPEVRLSNHKPKVVVISLDPGSCSGCLFPSRLRAFRLKGWRVALGLIAVSMRTGAIDPVRSKLVEV
jgi:hypothetical protein